MAADPVVKYMNRGQVEKAIQLAQRNMDKAARELDFVMAALYRDEIAGLKDLLGKI